MVEPARRMPRRNQTRASFQNQADIEGLEMKLSHGSGWTKSQELEINKLRAQRSDTMAELDEIVSLLKQMRESVGAAGMRLRERRKEIAAAAIVA